jgi:WhiB family redox-sensing transcriptional regulator
VLDPSFAAFLDEQLAYAIHDMCVERPSWIRKAACRGWSTSLWFPERGDPDNGRTAKRICASCPVSVECLAEALELSDDANASTGIWAGLSGTQRRRARRDIG